MSQRTPVLERQPGPPLHLHAEAVGDPGARHMVFIHPNPLDRSCWMFQTAELAYTFRCVTVDLPGYGRSPAVRDALTMPGIADACWQAVERCSDARDVVLVGCSVGGSLVQHMYHRHPERTSAVVVTGSGYRPDKAFARHRIELFRRHGIAHRAAYIRDSVSEEFARTPLFAWLVAMYEARADSTDVETIIAMFEAHGLPDPEWLQRELAAPVLILSGSRDSAHEATFLLHERLPESQMHVIDDAGHLAFLEKPWEFNRLLLDFLRARGIAGPPRPLDPSPHPDSREKSVR